MSLSSDDEYDSDAPVAKRKREGAIRYFPPNKVKAIMQQDNSIGKVGKDATEYLSSVCMALANEVITTSIEIAQEQQQAIIYSKNISEVLQRDLFTSISNGLQKQET